ncbi:MAG: hypothetical protein WBV39_00530, partial [Rudaea sp.]
TALGDWLASAPNVGFLGGALIFGLALLIVVGMYFYTGVSRVGLFWAAFILTRPLGATVGDFLDKPVGDGGLGISLSRATAILAMFIVAGIFVSGWQARAAGDKRA